MIETIDDLLTSLKEKEQALLKKYDIVRHPGVIGDMYEGLSKDLLEKVIFKGLNLKVSAGMIRGDKGKLSSEIDAMIVVGEGEQIPHTDKYIYESEKVIAVIQVKKNLYSKDIASSYDNLRSVITIVADRLITQEHRQMQKDAYRSICQKQLPPNKKMLELESPFYQNMYNILLLEAIHPARIVWGYNGFKTEFTLREAFASYLQENLTSDPSHPTIGYSPLNFPNLIICDQFSLIKNTGLPFTVPIQAENCWYLYCSSNKNAMRNLVEIIWTRLHYLYQLSSNIFGEDLKNVPVHPFLSATFTEKNEQKGWEYAMFPLSKQDLLKPLSDKEWEPAFLNQAEYDLINWLCIEHSVPLKDDRLSNFLKARSTTFEQITTSLKMAGLISIENDCLTLLAERCLTGILPDGRYFAGENKTGRLTRWAIKHQPK